MTADLKRAFGDMKGFSPRNLKYMRAVAEAWTFKAIVQQLVAQLPWGTNVPIRDGNLFRENSAGELGL